MVWTGIETQLSTQIVWTILRMHLCDFGSSSLLKETGKEKTNGSLDKETCISFAVLLHSSPVSELPKFKTQIRFALNWYVFFTLKKKKAIQKQVSWQQLNIK